jgi:hypothetical protein
MSLSSSLKAALCLLLFGLLAAAPRPAQAQVTITEVVPLSFGEIVITNFAIVARVTITATGGFTRTGNVFFIQTPTRGRYDIAGAPPNTLYTVTLPSLVTLTGPGGRTFRLDSFTVRPTTLRTTAAGTHSFFIGGRLRTQTGGQVYGDGTYSGTVTVTVAF